MMDGSAINANIIYLQVVPRLEDKSFNRIYILLIYKWDYPTRTAQGTVIRKIQDK